MLLRVNFRLQGRPVWVVGSSSYVQRRGARSPSSQAGSQAGRQAGRPHEMGWVAGGGKTKEGDMRDEDAGRSSALDQALSISSSKT